MKKIQKIVFVIIVLLCATTAFAGMQDKRKAFIQKLISNNIFQKVEVPGSLPLLWVKSGFYALSFKDKSSFVNIVFAYYKTMDSSYNLVVLYDSHSGKKVGIYGDPYGGLKMY